MDGFLSAPGRLATGVIWRSGAVTPPREVLNQYAAKRLPQRASKTAATTVWRRDHLVGAPATGWRAIEASPAATIAAEGRRSGSFTSIERNSEPSGSPIFGRSPVNHPGSDVLIAWRVRAAVSCRNGWRPPASSV